MEGIAREGFEMWRYQRNLNGLNEGLNVVMHFSHVGACTGRDHFSGWSLDWINLALGYLPFLRRFYAPADARAAFLAVRDAAAEFGGHIVAIPARQPAGADEAGIERSAVDRRRTRGRRSRAIGSTRAPRSRCSRLARRAISRARPASAPARRASPPTSTSINGFPLPEDFLDGLVGALQEDRHGRGRADRNRRTQGCAASPAYVASALYGSGVALDHFGIVDPQIAPSDHFVQVWEHYGITEEEIAESILSLVG